MKKQSQEKPRFKLENPIDVAVLQVYELNRDIKKLEETRNKIISSFNYETFKNRYQDYSYYLGSTKNPILHFIK